MVKKVTPIKETVEEQIITPRTTLMDAQPDILGSMYKDISEAKKSIFLEIYRIAFDFTGEKFRNILAEKAAQGVKVVCMFDSWGTPPQKSFFEPIIRNGGEVLFFRKIKFFVDFFTKNHRRNHRKLLIIDDEISYIGSINITGYSATWRELCLRIEGPIALVFKKTFFECIKLKDKYIFNKFNYKKTIYYNGFEIIQDLPSIYRQMIKKRYEKFISKATKEIIVETPYFMPGYKLRKFMYQAAERGVNVTVIMPRHSDVRLVDLLRDKYLMSMHEAGINMQFYLSGNLHAKCLMVDKEAFVMGSANFDYRSFRYQHEIMLAGKQPEIVDMIDKHLQESLKVCHPFDPERYRRRPLIEKFFGWMLIPFRHLF
jgi:cardiolipin synthase